MIEIKKAERAQSKLRIGLAGPSGSGKTMSSLKLARGMAGPDGKICMIDTERGSGQLYAHVTNFDYIELKAPYAPKNYVEAIQAAEDGGYDVVIIDSLSHAWTDEGGLLDQADKLSKGGNRFTVWADLTPQHRKLVNGMLGSDCHIIATVRSKQEYTIEHDDKTGRNTVKKLGMAPVQREGMEYEFTVFMDIEQTHAAHASKDRTDLFKDEVFIIDESIGKRLIEWLNAGKKVETVTNREQRMTQRKGVISGLIKAISAVNDHVPKTADEYMALSKSLTGLELIEANYDEITSRLKVRYDELVEAGKLTRDGKVIAQPKVIDLEI